MPPTILSILLSVLMAGATEPATEPAFRTTLNGSEIQASYSRTQRRDDTLVVITFQASDGEELLNLHLLQYGPGEVSFRSVVAPGFPEPLILVESTFLRADGASFDLVAVGLKGGKLSKLFASTGHDAADGICVRESAGASPPGVVVARWVEGDEGVLGWPKQFRVVEYEWREESLTRVSSRLTTERHADWEAALVEYSVPCSVNLLAR